MGFIVQVKAVGTEPVLLESDTIGKDVLLQPGESRVGFFWQMDKKDEQGKFHSCYIALIEPVERKKKSGEMETIFTYLQEIIVDASLVEIEVVACRGQRPKSGDSQAKWNVLPIWKPSSSWK